MCWLLLSASVDRISVSCMRETLSLALRSLWTASKKSFFGTAKIYIHNCIPPPKKNSLTPSKKKAKKTLVKLAVCLLQIILCNCLSSVFHILTPYKDLSMHDYKINFVQTSMQLLSINFLKCCPNSLLKKQPKSKLFGNKQIILLNMGGLKT